MSILTFSFHLTSLNVDVRDIASMFVYKFLQDEYHWMDVLADYELHIREIRVESILTRIPYTSSMKFHVHIHADVPEGMAMFYPTIDSNIESLILVPLRYDLERIECYDCVIQQKR